MSAVLDRIAASCEAEKAEVDRLPDSKIPRPYTDRLTAGRRKSKRTGADLKYIVSLKRAVMSHGPDGHTRYESIRIAAEENNCCPSVIWNSIRHKEPDAKGLQWSYTSSKKRAQIRPVVGLLVATGEEFRFDSIAEASRATKARANNITDCCAGRRNNLVKGYKWRYADDQAV